MKWVDDGYVVDLDAFEVLPVPAPSDAEIEIIRAVDGLPGTRLLLPVTPD